MQKSLRLAISRFSRSLIFRSRVSSNLGLLKFFYLPLRFAILISQAGSIHEFRTLRNSLLAPSFDLEPTSDISLHLVYVVAKKDLKMLKESLSNSLNVLGNFEVPKVTVIVQSGSIHDAKEELREFSIPIEVLDEEELISRFARDLLSEKFGSRYGWALQQFLKLHAVLSNNECATLVVDSDTLLVKPRNWIDSNKVQVLLPTEECHTQYYNFLIQMNLKVNRDFSFISHHMVYQPLLLRQCILEIGVDSIEELIKVVCSFEFEEASESFFSLDYEMYAQFLINNYPEFCRIEKWGNVDHDFLNGGPLPHENHPGLMSISAHSWKK